MNKNIELEYKVLVTKEQFEALYERYNKPSFRTQVNVYYDTLDMAIRKTRGSMRIRDLYDRHIFTFKMGSQFGLLEFEKDVPSNSLESLEDEEICNLLARYHFHGPFKQLTKLKTQRAIINTGNAELCFDISEYNGHMDYEIEYEYLKDHDGLHDFQAILDTINVTYTHNCSSKIVRALASLQD